MKKTEYDFLVNDEYYNCEDAVNEKFPTYLDNISEDTGEIDKEVPTLKVHLESYVNELNYNYMRHQWGLSDDEYQAWLDERDNNGKIVGRESKE